MLSHFLFDLRKIFLIIVFVSFASKKHWNVAGEHSLHLPLIYERIKNENTLKRNKSSN
jgi:hypothetical protein